LEILEESGDLSPDELAYRVKIQGELFKMYEEEESYWHQIAHGKWLLEGD
jgi:hypothetical protein